ncbi:MAG: cation transporter, partial [Clostridia bacterium]|nr:cation transporter [Clostridia bacterium]
MKTEKNILIAFILNLAFSIFELIGGIFTNSVAIISDAVHDFGDATSIGISFILEKISKRQPDEKHTYGYVRYSLIGGLITTAILLFGSCVVIYNAVCRIIDPMPINYDGMIVFGVVGVFVNFIAAYFTRDGDSINQKAVNLHMLEDVLGWLVILIGAIVMRFTDISIIDPILSICVAVFILFNAVQTLKIVVGLFLEKTPENVDISEIKEHLLNIEGVTNVHHIHVWSLDGHRNYATLHIVTDADPHETKERVRAELEEHGICHATLELE